MNREAGVQSDTLVDQNAPALYEVLDMRIKIQRFDPVDLAIMKLRDFLESKGGGLDCNPKPRIVVDPFSPFIIYVTLSYFER